MSDQPEDGLEYQLGLQVEILCEEWEKIGLETGAIKRSLEAVGALETVRKYATGPIDAGVREARKRLGRERTMEGPVESDEFRELFTEDEIAAAQRKLDSPG